MTLMIIWPNKVENPTSLHLATDSLLSCDATRWPYASKIFRVFPTHAYIGYCGTSLVALHAVMQGTHMLHYSNILADYGTSNAPTVDAKSGAFVMNLDRCFKAFPDVWGNKAELLYCGFDDRERRFRIMNLSLSSNGIARDELDIKGKRYLCFGSGAAKAEALLRSKEHVKSRDVLEVLDTIIADDGIRTVGGVPQMVIIRKHDSQPVGFSREIDGRTESTLFGIPLQFTGERRKVIFFGPDFHREPYLHQGGVRRVAQLTK